MKQITTVLVFVVFPACIFMQQQALAQLPEKMSYQAVIRNGDNNLVTNSPIGIKVSILKGSESGTVVYAETQAPTANANGLVTIEIGSGTIVSGSFATIDWTSGTYFIKTETDPAGGTNYTIIGISQILSVPYALHAKTAENFTGTIDETDPIFIASPANGITSTNMTNWNLAFGWGSHSGLYRPIGYVPSWSEVTGKPTFATVAASGSYNDLSNKPTILNSQWTTSGGNIYYNTGNVGIGTSSPATLIHAHGSPVPSRGQLSLSSPVGQDVFLSFYETNIFKAYLWYNITDQDLRLQNYTAGDLNLNPYGGNVGIGTNTPNESLTVNGNAEINGNIIPNGKIIAQGNITIESKGDNVILLAGANKITIDPSGGVTIESNSVTVAATGDLILSGNHVHINGRDVDIKSSASLELEGTMTKLNGTAITEIKGGFVKIN